MDTWGVSGPTFLLIYLSLGAGIVALVNVARHRLSAPSTLQTIPASTSHDPCDLALVNDGETLAVVAAIGQLRSVGAIEPDTEDSSRLNVESSLPARLDPLEEAVFEQLRESPNSSASQLSALPTPSAILASMRDRLVAEGLMLTDSQRRRIRRQSVWVFALLGLGVTRIVAGIANHRPVGLLVLLVGGVAAVVLPWSLRAPIGTTLGRRYLKEARREAGDLSAKVSAGDPRLGLAVALFGVAAMWNGEPWLAAALDLQKSGGGWLGGGGCGGCGGGCGG